MNAVSIFSTFLLLFLLLNFAKLNALASLMWVSVFFLITELGSGSVGHVAMMSVAFFSLFHIKFKSRNFLLTLLLALSLSLVIFLCLRNGGDFVASVYKLLDILSLYVLSVVVAPNISSSGKGVYSKAVFCTLLVSFGVGVVAHLIFDIYNEGQFRYSGVSFDANYFALYVLVLYVGLDCEGKPGLVGVFGIVSILASMSATGILMLIVYMLARKRIPDAFCNVSAFAFFIIVVPMCYVAIMYNLQELIFAFSGQGEGTLLYKIVSMMHRLEAQITALELLEENGAWLSGFGSGRNIELTGRATHNMYIQLLFSHGFIYYVIVVASIISAVRWGGVKVLGEDRKRYFSIFYILSFACLLLDPLTNYFGALSILVFSLHFKVKRGLKVREMGYIV